MSEQTIRVVSVETGISRSTLLQAAQQGRIPARQSGKIWLIKTDSKGYEAWLANHWNQPRVKGKEKREEQNNGEVSTQESSSRALHS